MELGARIIVQHITDFFVIWHYFSEVSRTSSIKRISPNLLNFSLAIHYRAWIIPGNGKLFFYYDFSGVFWEHFPNLLPVHIASAQMQVPTSAPGHFFTETLQHTLQHLGFREQLVSTVLNIFYVFPWYPVFYLIPKFGVQKSKMQTGGVP